MNIIQHVAAPTKYRIEERTIDATAGQDIDLIASPNLLLNPTLTARDVHTTSDPDGSWNAFRRLVATGKFAPGTGRRLVLKAGDR